MKGHHLLPLLCLLRAHAAAAWYLPGSVPNDYQRGAPLAIKVDRLTSSKTQVPFDYYHLPYCQPQILSAKGKETLGEQLGGGVIRNTSYDVKMLQNVECQLLCVKELSDEEKKLFSAAIEDEYLANFIADDLPGAMSLLPLPSSPPEVREGVPRIPSSREPRGQVEDNQLFTLGIPIGAQDGSNHVLVNHWDFVIKYHNASSNAFRVVGFEVSPQSLAHTKTDDAYSCEATEPLVLEHLKANNRSLYEVPFTYSVSFIPSKEVWTTRWDLYLRDASGSSEIHWFSVLNALLIVLLLSGLLAMILLRTVLRDIARYNRLEDLEGEGLQEETGWKLVHGDVFRRPRHSRLLAVCAGTGIQLLGMAVATVIAGGLGFMSPLHRGSYLQAMLILFIVMGYPAGYVSARFSKLFDADSQARHLAVTAGTALLFPGVCFTVFFVLNAILWSKRSSGAASFSTMFLLLSLWFGISVPTVLFGAYHGYKKGVIETPVRTNQIPRQIPPSRSWLSTPLVSHALTGIFPLCAVFTELFFVLGSVWQHRFYFLFGFILMVLIILVLTCAMISIASTYFVLCAENYGWWWHSFWASATSGLYLFVYGIFFFFARLEITKTASVVLYFGYTALMSYAFCLLTGAIGFLASFFFVKAIYGAVKVD